MDKTVVVGGREFKVAPLNLRVIRRLMASGKFDKLQHFSALGQEEQLDVMMAFVAASLNESEDWFWDNLGIDDFKVLPQVFNDIMGASGFKGADSPNVESR